MKQLIAAICLLALSLPAAAQPLDGTKPLDATGDLASQMIDGIDRFLDRELAESVEKRQAFWRRDTSSPEKYAESVEPNRKRLAKMLGVVDERVKETSPRFISGPGKPSLVARGENYEIHAIRWEALPGVHGEGLLVLPTKEPSIADIVWLPEADQSPEAALGLAAGADAKVPAYLAALRAAEMNCRILIPALVDRSDAHSVAAGGARPTNQPHREFVYRPAFEMGRHVIGYEIQKVLAAIDWFASDAQRGERPVGVMGYGEGGLLALYAGALDARIGIVTVSGYFGSREKLWAEPIYRNVQGLLREFGDAEIASLIAPRTLMIDVFPAPRFDGPPPPRDGRSGAAPGRVRSPDESEVRGELARLKGMAPTGWEARLVVGDRFPFEAGDLRPYKSGDPVPSTNPPERLAPLPDPAGRQKRQVGEMQAFTQSLVRKSDDVRRGYWAKAGRSSVEKWEETTEPLRRAFYEDVIGKFDRKLLDANPRTRKVYDEPKYAGYEVMLDVFPDVFAYGILLVPKDVKPGERRPVVVCQHGLEGRPQNLADPKIDHKSYHQLAIKLAERGFVTYSPQNPYIFGDRFRMLQRKLNPLGKQLFSIIIPQHEQTLNWLSTLPFVDPQRVAFYGLSYGGKTAMRVPAVEKRYCLSICSGDFNEWIWKTTSLTFASGYPATGEWEIFEWDLGHTFNYAEMAGLIAPRPLMVERGHHDGVAPDEWVGYEYAKVRLLYAELGIPQRTRIEYFLGPHEIHGVGTFEFLHEQLKWPKPPNR